MASRLGGASALAWLVTALLVPASAITHNILTSYQTQSGSLTGTAAATSDTKQNADVVMTAGGTNIVLAVAINTPPPAT